MQALGVCVPDMTLGRVHETSCCVRLRRAGGRPRAGAGRAGFDRRQARRSWDRSCGFGRGGSSSAGRRPHLRISGHVLDFDGNGVPGAEVDWGWWDSSYNYQSGGTNMPGRFAGDRQPPALSRSRPSSAWTPQGRRPRDRPTSRRSPRARVHRFLEPRLRNASNDATPYSYEMRPGHVNIDIANAPTSTATLARGEGRRAGRRLCQQQTWLSPRGAGVGQRAAAQLQRRRRLLRRARCRTARLRRTWLVPSRLQ